MNTVRKVKVLVVQESDPGVVECRSCWDRRGSAWSSIGSLPWLLNFFLAGKWRFTLVLIILGHLETHSDSKELHSGALKSHSSVVKTHSGSLESDLRAMKFIPKP